LNDASGPFFFNARHDGEPKDEVIKKIKSKSLYILEQNGFKEAMFFAISTRDRRIGQFDELVSYIQSNLPEWKSKAVNISMVGSIKRNCCIASLAAPILTIELEVSFCDI
jgi:hypothetical protein